MSSGRRRGLGLRVRAEIGTEWNGDFNREITEGTEKSKEREIKWLWMGKRRRRGVRLYPCPGTTTPAVREL